MDVSVGTSSRLSVRLLGRPFRRPPVLCPCWSTCFVYFVYFVYFPKSRPCLRRSSPRGTLRRSPLFCTEYMPRRRCRSIKRPFSRSQRWTHSRCLRGARSLAENGRTGDQRPPTGSERRTVGIQGLTRSRSLSCSRFLRRDTRSSGKHRSADAPHSQLPWSARGAARHASWFALPRRASPRHAPELRMDRAQSLHYPCPSSGE